MVMVVTQGGLRAYIIEVGPRFPHWVALPIPGTAHITDCRLFMTSTNILSIAVMAGDGMYIADPNTIDQDGWREDRGVRGGFRAGLKAFDIGSSLGSPRNSSVFGYAGASPEVGLAFLTGGAYDKVPIVELVSERQWLFNFVW
jgi:hypothetical protein